MPTWINGGRERYSLQNNAATEGRTDRNNRHLPAIPVVGGVSSSDSEARNLSGPEGWSVKVWWGTEYWHISLSPHKMLIKYGGKDDDFVIEKPCRHPPGQMVRSISLGGGGGGAPRCLPVRGTELSIRPVVPAEKGGEGGRVWAAWGQDHPRKWKTCKARETGNCSWKETEETGQLNTMCDLELDPGPNEKNRRSGRVDTIWRQSVDWMGFVSM